MRRSQLVLKNIRRNPKNLIFSAVGVVFGVSVFFFFMALGIGVQTHVVDQVFVEDQLRVVPRTVSFGALASRGSLFSRGTGLDAYTVEDLLEIDGVEAVYPEQQMTFPSYVTGGEEVLGQAFWTELISNGIPVEVAERDLIGSEDPTLAFRDWEAWTSCGADGACAPGSTCDGGTCVATPCVPPDEVWAGATEREAQNVRRQVRQRMGREAPRIEIRDLGEDVDEGRFRLATRHSADDVRARLGTPTSGAVVTTDDVGCEVTPSYCQITRRQCEMPVPVIVSPTMLELYNANVRGALSGSSSQLRSLPAMTEEAFIGFGFEGILGRGYLGESQAVDAGEVEEERVELRIVGFSPRAMTIGATFPLPYVERWNARFHDEEAAEHYHGLLVVVDEPSRLHEVAETITSTLELEIDPRYTQARRASLMVTLLTAVFALLSVLIVMLAGLNIMHTFLMVVAERRHEIGVLRAVGARRLHVYSLIVGEALIVAVIAGTLALAIGWGATEVIDGLFANNTPDFPFKPDHLFATPMWLYAASYGLAVLACVLGASLPALRAAQQDPADALRAAH